MLSALLHKVRDISVVKRMSFAAAFMPRDMPNYWQAVAEFSVMDKPSRNVLTVEQVKTLIENLEVMDPETFITEHGLIHQLVTMTYPGIGTPMGIILISSKERCNVCGSALKIRADRPSTVTLYDDRMGMLLATHFTKYCRKTGCSFQQHYGYFTLGESAEITYDHNWQSLPYFMSSQETAFTMDMLQRFDAEILIGQISYKQRADIYNKIHR